MQGGHLHHLQQQQQHLAALLSAALPPATTTTTTTTTAADPSSSDSSPGSDDSARVAALDSLQRAILHPANSLLLSHSAPFLSQGFSQLLSTDKSYAVRRAAAVAYGSLCAVLASTGGLVDRFISWALPLLGDNGVRTGPAELALESLKEFLNSGDASAVERFVPSILKACQELLEDERTSLSLLRNLLGILTLISLKFGHCFQPHFIDIVDVLLGWAFVPGLSESDRDMITDSFLQFQSHWLSNLNFSLRLLSKFLGDMEVLVQDLSLETGQQLGRLLALFNCFSKVLQVTASGMMEMNLLEQISEPIESMAPRLLKLILMFGYKFGWSKWIGESWRCLILLAEIMREQFSGFYSMAIDVFFQSLRGLSSSQVHGLLKSNLQLLSMQNLGMLSSSVQSLLKFESPLSQLRMHPNHSVVASVAATYLFFLQHSSAAIVSQAICSLMEELELLTGLLENMSQGAGSQFSTDIVFCKNYSEPELLSLIKFDLKMLLCSVSVGPANSCPDQTVTITTRYERSTRLASFILEKLDPFQFPIHGYLELQVHVIRALHKLSETEFLSRLACLEQCLVSASDDLVGENQGASGTKGGHSILTIEFLRKYSVCVARALNASSAFSVKLEALDWICTFGREVVNMSKDVDLIPSFGEPCRDTHIGCNLLILILDAAYNREMKVRFQVASVLEVLLQASLLYPGNFCFVSEVALDKLSDPDTSVRNAYARVLSIVLPLTIYACGFAKDRGGFCNLGPAITGNRYHMKWKQVLGIKQSSRKLHSQQFVSILSYISQRWKVPLSSWIQRLVFSCHGRKDFSPVQHEKSENLGADIVWKDAKLEGAILDELCPVNNLAAIWWSIHEAARHCITLRLRTNLGGPTQTFAALERMLLDIPNVLLLDTEQSEGKYIASSNFHLLPMRLLLEFVEALKKNVYNAYEGSSVLPCSTRQSSLFFRANKKVCEEWFSRICDPMMNAGLALHCHDATLNYCMLRLQDLRNLVASTFKEKNRDMSENLHSLRVRLEGDVLKVLRHASLALCRSHEPEALAGLQKWAAMTFSTLFVNDNKVNPGVCECSMVFSWMTGLVYQAEGQYEKAAAHFSHLLQSEEALSSMDSDGIQFVIARIIESYTSLSDWKSLESWLSELQALRAAHAGRAYSGALTAAGNELNAIHALARFDEGDIHAAWNYLDLTPKTSSELTLDPKLALERSEQMLLRSMLQRGGQADKVLEDLNKATLMLDEPLSVISLHGLNEAASCATQLHCIFAFEEGTRFSSQDEAKQLLARSLDQVLCMPISRIQQDTSLWIKIFRVYCTVLPTSSVTLRLGQKLLSLARKQKNFILANRMKKYLREHLPTCDDGIHKEILSANLQYESILLRYTEGNYEEALIDLWSLVRPNVMSTNSFASDSGAALQAKACLKLSTWLRQENANINLRNVSLRIYEDFSTYDALDGSSFTKCGGSSEGDRIYDNWIFEEIVGIATKGSCHLCPTLGKAWLSYASWCFSQAKDPLPAHGAVLQSSSVSPVLHPEVSPDRFQLTEEETSRVEIIITKICHGNRNVLIQSDFNEEYLDSFPHPKNEALVKSLVQQTAYLMQTAAGAPGFEASDGKCPSAALCSQLLVLFHCLNTDVKKSDLTSYVDELVDIWWSLRRRRVSLFGHAAKGYFRYLSLSSSQLQDNNFVSFHLDVVNEKTKSCTLKAMLYVLHILLNYGDELRETLERGFATVPLLPWQEITPQLFSRLSSHPKGAVRKQLEGLLIMLAKFSPWSIVYPLLVDINAYEGNPSEELQRILDCLVKLYPKLVQDTQLVINSLATITVLWEEQWLSTLQDLHADVVRRINMLKDEATRIAENITLSHTEKNKISAAKYSAMMAPIIVALERRLASTSREPETAHEIWFHEEYGEQLKSAILAFKTPPVSPAALGDVWRPFDAIAASLATCHKKSSIYLGDVAPQLASLSSSEVPMPGLEKQISSIDSYKSTADVQGIITISFFCEEVAVLSTKTKPKKLVLLGSDGQKYTYLLKGREDLRLDARIMQLLQAVNSFLNSCNKTRSRSLAIRYYSVTPISGRAGLIQWVDNVTSIYSVYKSWQNRAQLSQLSATGAGLSSPLPPVPRPSDMFYGKIIPALKEKGIRKVISRRDWPHEVKRKVLLELMKETPRQLLWQEMWCASEGFRAFNLKTKRFSGSVASMSIVGHVLGLGDRHLDNILMDFCSGDVIHIDYNVCFDKGRRLKIPEIVPFRLTQTIETALGLTGVEGTFRVNCEAIFDILRKNKDIILMLLEVFIWDPLVEWARGDNDEAAIGGEEKKGMELAVSLSLFASRFQEIRVPLQEHHDLLVSALPAAESSLKKFLDVLNQYEVISSIFYHADKERTNLLQHEASAKSIAAEATSISEKCRQSFEVQAQEFAQAKSVAMEKAQEAAMWVDQHGRVLDALRTGSIPDAQACLRLSSMEEAVSLTSAVLVSGVPLTIVPEPTQAQCYDLDRDVSHLIAELENGLSGAIEGLQEYALTLQRVLPLNYVTTSPVNTWAQVLQLSVNNLSADILSLARRQAADIIAKAQGDGLDSVQQRHRDLFHNMERYAIEIEKVDDECSELMRSIGSDAEAKSKERLLSAFTKYMHSAGYSSKEDHHLTTRSGQNKLDGSKDFRLQGDVEEKKVKVLSILRMAANELYKEVKDKVISMRNISSGRTAWRLGEVGFRSDSGIAISDFEEKIEKCALIAGFVNEVQELIGIDLASINFGADSLSFERNWAPVFQASLRSSRHLIEELTEVVLPEIIRSFVSYNSEVMEAFGSLSQIRGTVDTTLEKLVEVELEKASLVELEKNYFVKVGLITEQQLALEEAAVKGRDNLSWEEAEELATQEEACRAQLDQLHQSWNQKDVRSTSLTKIEANVRNSLTSLERHFSSLVSGEQDGDIHIRSSKALIAALVKPFFELESVDQMLSAYGTLPSHLFGSSFGQAEFITSNSVLYESTWRFSDFLKNHAFFIWKVGFLDSILDLCIHDISCSVDRNFSFDQLYNVLKKKIEVHLREHVGQYLIDRVAPALLAQLERENESLHQMIATREDLVPDQVRNDSGALRRVQHMLEEYCNAHETARAARSAISVMKRQLSGLTEAVRKTILEIAQMEWIHELSLPHLLKTKVLSPNILGDDKFSLIVRNLSRPKFLEKIQSSMSSIARSLEALQVCERTSVSAEGQLERAMGWACAGSGTVRADSSSTRNSGIPSEFHEHLLRRRQILWAAREQASDIIKICTSVMEFEASRDGLFRTSEEKSSGWTSGDGRAWQQAYLNTLTRLDVSYHSFTCAEQEWKLARNNMEIASNSLLSATNELHVASVKAKSASGDLQDTLATLRDCAYEASVALSAFGRVSKGHTALTSECGSMLEEVLVITEGLHDIHSLAKDAAAAHHALMADLSKANIILLPLEASLSTDVTALGDAIQKEQESNADVSPIHGQALYQSYCLRIREACQSLTSLVPSLTYSVEALHSMLTNLARASSTHAGNLHKALEGLGDSQVVRSQDLALSRSEISDGELLFDKEKRFVQSNEGSIEDLATVGEFSLEDEDWISPPDHSYTSSSDFSVTSTEASLSETSDGVGKVPHSIDFREDSFTDDHGQERIYAEKQEPDFTVGNANGATISLPSDSSESMQVLSSHVATAAHVNHSSNKMENVSTEEEKSLCCKIDLGSLKLDKGDSGSHNESSDLNLDSQITRGKNAYALSVLRQVERKLDGRDIEEMRSMSISELVDHLLKQATSLDNLCNMYEGWTPWI